MWSTGFATEPQGIAEDEDTSIALKWMRETARRLSCAISGSLAIRVLQAAQTSGNEYIYKNRHYFIDGKTGFASHYDKHHLFHYGHEDRYYQPGNRKVVVEYGGVRFLLLTCYDLRFPVWSRYSDKYPYDVIIAVANWPDSRQSAWEILTRARAVENQAILIGCNRVGSDKYSHYEGHSLIISPIGEIVASCPTNQQSSCTIELNLDDLTHKRTKFRVLDDCDRFSFYE